MAKTVRTRVSGLNKDVSVLRLTSTEIKRKFFDESSKIRIETDDDGLESELFVLGASSVVAVLLACINGFEDKILPELKSLDDESLNIVVSELYRECIMANPCLDRMAFGMYTTAEPMDDDLERLVNMLPEMNHMLVEHGFRSSVTDHYLLNDVISSEHVLDVPDESIEVLSESELILDQDRVRSLSSELTSRMVGQRHAIDHMVTVARRASIGFHDPSRPPAVSMFVGPPGVGKTMLAKETAEVLFGKNSFGRIDCAQLAEKSAYSKLLGPAPGYVGYPSDRDASGNRTKDIKTLDPSLMYKETLGMANGGILLFDEIEKADSDVLDVLLTAFDEGYVKTSVGNKIDLRNVFIIITSNLGSRELADASKRNHLGFGAPQASCEPTEDITAIRKTTMDAIREWMKPELLSRVSSVVPFTALSTDEMAQVVDLEWIRASEYLHTRIEADIVISPDLRQHIAQKAQDRNSGARYVSRLVDSYFIDTIAEMYTEIDGVLECDSVVTLEQSPSTSGCDAVIALWDGGSFEHVVSETMGD